MTVSFFNPYDYRIPVTAEKYIGDKVVETYQCSALPKTKGELLEGFKIGATTIATYPRLQVLETPKSDKDKV